MQYYHYIFNESYSILEKPIGQDTIQMTSTDIWYYTLKYVIRELQSSNFSPEKPDFNHFVTFTRLDLE